MHIALDAGHIAVESDLVSKDDVREIRRKRNQQYNQDDFDRLESLMYDRFTVTLQDAQVRG
jgi:vacuolar protein sorting-associated protein 13A/C